MHVESIYYALLGAWCVLLYHHRIRHRAIYINPLSFSTKSTVECVYISSIVRDLYLLYSCLNSFYKGMMMICDVRCPLPPVARVL